MLPDPTTSGVIPQNTAKLERVLDLVRRGVLVIDDEGCIWRHGEDFSGGVVPCEPRRADKVDKAGYMVIRLHSGDGKNKAKTEIYSHRIVYAHCIGPIPDLMDINHIDGVKTNNHPENLELLTRGQNVQHAYATGLYDHKMGENRQNAKLTNDQVIEMRAEYAKGGISQRTLANRYGVTQSIIAGIMTGARWKTLLKDA